MGYLKEFQTQIINRDLEKFLKLWEEYCTCDVADVEEMEILLNAVKTSDFSKAFGKYVEMAIPLWETIKSDNDSYAILKLIIDLQTTNSQRLGNLALESLVKKHGCDPLSKETQEQLRLVGLRSKDHFQAALSHFDLLIHLKKGNFVYHPSGFGAGEIMDVSQLKELVSIEFENASGVKQITFLNAFKSLTPLPSAHFLARRFSNPDLFEKEARTNPVEVIKLLLKDLGPKTAAEIKDELEELVIPSQDWQRWWQNTRSKLKKDIEIKSPGNPKDPFLLRKEAVSHEDQFLETLSRKKTFSDVIATCYAFIRDHTVKLKNQSIKDEIVNRLNQFLESETLSSSQNLQVCFCLDSLLHQKHDEKINRIIQATTHFEQLIDEIDILVYKKAALGAIKERISDWPSIFVKVLETAPQGIIRDYLIKELIHNGHKSLLEERLKGVLNQPWQNPEFFYWYYNKLMDGEDSELPFSDSLGKNAFSEGLLILLNRIENDLEQKELTKKIAMAFLAKRYQLVRQIFDGSSLDFTKEFLLLASKCHTITDHDLKIWRSLAEVVHPSLNVSSSKEKEIDFSIFWTTEKNLLIQQEHLKKISSTDVVEIAKEIEIARALGDLRENSEYKTALEKRAHLQREIKKLSQDISHARILTPSDVSSDQVGIGSVIEAIDPNGQKLVFKIMGPWEANPDEQIISFHSKVAQNMAGLHVGDLFKFKDFEYTIEKLGSIFDEE